MLRKKTALTILFLGLFYGHSASAEWKEYKVQSIINSNEYLLENGQRYVFRDLIFPDFNVSERVSDCFKKDLKFFLENQINRKKVLINVGKENKRVRNKPFYIQGDIKLKKPRTNLKEFFIEQGWAKAPIKSKKFEKLQKKSIKGKKGYWGSCAYGKELNEVKVRNGDSYFFRDKKPFIKSTSVGWVKSIINYKTIKLHNGVYIEISNIKPVTSKDQVFNQCIKGKTKAYLENLLLGKKVILEKENLQATGSKTLIRHIQIPKTKSFSGVLVSQNLIQNGLVFVEENENKKHLTLLKSTEEEAYRQLPESWISCLQNIEQEIPESKNKLIYDQKCKIKGNISGSKKNPKKTYHTPLSGWYKRIKPEKCFQNEVEAKNAGFIKVK